MEENEIERQIAEMKDKGVGGFFICARQGMKIPYLSKVWFDRVRFAVKTAEKYGLNAWLYDEYPYPSGIAGGDVTLEHPEAVQRMLARTVVAAQGGEAVEAILPWGKVLSAKAVPLAEDGSKDWSQSVDIAPWIGSFQDETVFHQTGSTNYSRKRYFTYNTVRKLQYTLPSSHDQWEIVVIIEQEVDDFKYYGTFVDPLHPKAVDTFLRLTHERYAEELKDDLGRTVKGMFTDEVGLRAGKIPWSPQIVPFFEERCGYNLLDKLHHLFEDAGPDTAEVRYNFFQCIHLLLREQFHRRVAEWCETSGMEYVAEVPSVRMTTQLYSHIPGGDSAHEKLGKTLPVIMERYAHSLRHNPKMGSSLARQLRRKRALIECFHSVGWSMTLQDARWMIDWMAVLGTNMFNFHAFFYSIDGLRKHDAAPSQFEQNPYWKHFKQLGDYIGRLSLVLSEGTAKIDIAVLDPTTSLWTQMGNPFHQFGFAGVNPEDKERLERLKSDWIHLQTLLLTHQRDFDTLDPEMLQQASISSGSLQIGAASYKVLIIPPVTNLESEAWGLIRSFIEAGGTVICVGQLPYETIEPQTNTVADVAALFNLQDSAKHGSGYEESAWSCRSKGAYFVTCASDAGESTERMKALLPLLDLKLPRVVEIVPEDGKAECLLVQHRQLDEQRDALFIVNHEGTEKKVRISLAESYFGTDLQLRMLSLEDGERYPLCSADLTLAPYQSHLIEVFRGQQELSASPQPIPHRVIASSSPWNIELAAPNQLRLGHFQMAVDPDDVGLTQEWFRSKEACDGVRWFDVEAKTWISQSADLADELQHTLKYTSRWFGTPFKVKFDFPVVCWYKAVFDVEQIPQACELYMDREAILGEHRLFVNGTEWSGGPLPLVAGENTIMVRIVIRHTYDGVVDPLYLQGAFGVYFNKDQRPVIAASPAAGHLGNAVAEGCPYYAGTMIFRRQIHLPAEEGVTGSIEFSLAELGPHFHDCAELSINGHSLGVRVWTPYVWTAPREWLVNGVNQVEVRIDNTLSLKLDGTYFDYASHQLKNTSTFSYSQKEKEERP